MVKEGATIIDVGTTRVPSTQTKWSSGDVKFDEALKMFVHHAVPGGVGPMTIVSLLKNTLLAAKGEIYLLIIILFTIYNFGTYSERKL